MKDQRREAVTFENIFVFPAMLLFSDQVHGRH